MKKGEHLVKLPTRPTVTKYSYPAANTLEDAKSV
jgi:hypothetical protein